MLRQAGAGAGVAQTNPTLSLSLSPYACVSVYMYLYIYIRVCLCGCVCVCARHLTGFEFCSYIWLHSVGWLVLLCTALAGDGGGWVFVGLVARLVVWWVSPDIFVEFAAVVVVVVVVVGSDASANSDCTNDFSCCGIC